VDVPLPVAEAVLKTLRFDEVDWLDSPELVAIA
jgi:hypothetical protein